MKDAMISDCYNGPLTRYIKLRVAHAPGIPETFSPPPRVSDPDMHHGMCMMHVPWCMLGSLTDGSLWSRWREKRSHSPRMRNPQFTISGKRHMDHTSNAQEISLPRQGGWALGRVLCWTSCVLYSASRILIRDRTKSQYESAPEGAKCLGILHMRHFNTKTCANFANSKSFSQYVQ